MAASLNGSEEFGMACSSELVRRGSAHYSAAAAADALLLVRKALLEISLA